MESNITGWFDMISKVGFPIVSAIAAGYFIFLTLKFILDGTLSSIKGLSGMITRLDHRVDIMSNDLIRIDVLVFVWRLIDEQSSRRRLRIRERLITC
jgi:hypothetical protein